MRLQEVENKRATGIEEKSGKTMTVFLKDQFYRLSGDLDWEMETEAVFCSDVMAFLPGNFNGTKAIFHPDDVDRINYALASGGEEISFLRFRIITTYGDTRTITGQNIAVEADEEASVNWKQNLGRPQFRQLQQKKETAHLQTLQQVYEQSNILTSSGSWYYNAATGITWFDDAVYRLHGLPPQSLNAHLHTFHSFLHPDDREAVIEFTGKAFQERTPLHVEYRIVVNKKEQWIRYASKWLFNEKGEEIFCGVLQDVTGMKNAEAETEAWKSLAQFQKQQVLYHEKQVNIGHWQIDLLTRKATYSDQYYRIFGVKPQSLPAHLNAFLNYIHPDDQEAVEALNKKIVHEQAVPELEYRIQRSDGKLRYVKQSGRLMMTKGNKVFTGILEDVTVEKMLKKKLADVALQKEYVSLQLQQSDETGKLASWVMDTATGATEWSPGIHNLLGYKTTTPEMSAKSLWSFIHPHDAGEFKNRWQMAVQQKQESDFHFRLLQKGVVRSMKAVFRIHKAGDAELFIGTLQDVTAEQSLQEHLSQRVQLAESLTENILDRVLITDENNTVVLWNKACERAYGLKREEAIGQNFFDLFPHLKTEAEMALFLRALGGEKVTECGKKSHLGNGYYDLYLMPLWQQQNITGVLHIIRNVTGEVELRKNLQERLLFIESLVEFSVDRIIALDRNLNYQYWNSSAEKYYGLPKETILGKNILDVFPQMVNDPSYAEFRKALRGETVRIAADAESERYFETYLIPVKDEKEKVTAILWVVHDLSKEFQLQEVQRKAQEQLAEEHRRLKDAQAIGHVGSFEWNAATNSIYWSDEMYRIHGLEPQSETLTLERVLSFIHPEDVETSFETLRQSRNTPCSVSMTHRIIRADGEVRTVARNLQSFANEAGQVIFLSGTVQDITEQKLAEQRIKEQANYITRITDTVPDMISVIELATGNAAFLNVEVFAANGFDAERMNARTAAERTEIIYPDDRPVLANYFRALALASDDNVAVADYRAKTDSGEWQWFSVRGKVFQRNEEGTVTHVLNVIENITRRKKAEEELIRVKDALTQKATDKYLNLFNAIDEGFYQCEVIFDEAGEPVDILYLEENPAAVRIIGQSFAGKTLRQINPGYEEHWFKIWGSVALTGKSKRMEQYSEPDKKWFDFYITKVGDKNSRQVAVVFENVSERKKTEQALRESEEKFRQFNALLEQQVAERTTALKESTEELQKHLTILQQAEDIAAIGGWEYQISTGRFSWSDGMYRIFDLPGGLAVQPEVYLDCVVDEDRPVAKRIVKQLRKLYQPFEETLRINRKDGIRLLKVKATVVCDEEGKPQKLVGVDKDITHIKTAEDKLAQSQYWLEQTTKVSPDAITIYDLQKKEPLYLNDGLAHWTGVPAAELVNMGIEGRLQLVHPDDRLPLLHFNEKIAAAKDGQVLMMEYRLLSKNEGIRWLRNRSKIFQRDKNGKVTHMLSILQDVTEERQAEARLKELNESLETKNKDLESKNEEITSFAFVASHDLKEPLRKIHTFSDWLLAKEEGISENGKQSLERLIGSVKRLDTLVDDIVALTKVHVGDEDAAAVDLNSVLNTALTDMQDVIQETHTKIIADNLPVVNGIENHLVYLFKNLLSNAVKFQPAGNKPVVRIEVLRRSDGVQISFADNGIGFSPEHSKKIFQMFQRLHGRTDFEGTGMGLAICKKIMEKHGGSIKAEGKPGKGSVFTCSFPPY